MINMYAAIKQAVNLRYLPTPAIFRANVHRTPLDARVIFGVIDQPHTEPTAVSRAPVDDAESEASLLI